MTERIFRFRGGHWPLGQKVYLLGILNVTPDSFSDGGPVNLDPEVQVERAGQLIQEGADGLDIGAESTRPGYQPVPKEEEWRRLEPVLKIIRQTLPSIPISIDTQKGWVAERALDQGANIINDIWGLSMDREIGRVVASAGAGLILMFNRLMRERSDLEPGDQLQQFFVQQLDVAQSLGIDRDQVLLDPGLGFALRGDDVWQALKALPRYQGYGSGVLVGASRKAFLGMVTGQGEPARRDVATAVLSALLALEGIDVLRVHNPAFTRDAIQVAQKWGETHGGY